MQTITLTTSKIAQHITSFAALGEISKLTKFKDWLEINRYKITESKLNEIKKEIRTKLELML